MKYARKNARVVSKMEYNLPLTKELDYLSIQTEYERMILRKHPKIAEGLAAISEMMNLKIHTLPAESVPLYFFPSTRNFHVNGRAKHIVEEANILSLGVLKANKSIDTTGLIKTPSTIPIKTFIEFATTVTIFGTLKTTRLTIPMGLNSNTSHVTQPLMS